MRPHQEEQIKNMQDKSCGHTAKATGAWIHKNERAGMSAISPKADIRRMRWNVRSGPILLQKSVDECCGR
jgi:hypothetical protein